MKGKEMEKKEKILRAVSDIGVSAYIKMHGFKCVGRKNRNFYFELGENQGNEFDQLCFDYGNSVFHDFDSCLMMLKKMPEFLPEK